MIEEKIVAAMSAISGALEQLIEPPTDE